MSKIHLTYKESDQYLTKGWVCFLTYFPDGFGRIGNQFYTIKNGNVWKHNDLNNDLRNYFYGELHESKLQFFVQNPENIDVFYKAIKLEGNDSWNVQIKTNLSEGHIKKEEFEKIESYYRTHFRKNERIDDLHGLKTQGIGASISFDGLKVFFDFVPDNVNVGDELYQSVNGELQRVSDIRNVGPNYVEVMNVYNTPIVGAFYLSIKNSRSVGSELRGYYADITLTNNSDYNVELYAIGITNEKSYV